jgi:hypothetical protein
MIQRSSSPAASSWGAELLDGERSMVRVELGGVDVGQPGGAEHLHDRERGAEHWPGGEMGMMTALG